jgi:hypothetical protein
MRLKDIAVPPRTHVMHNIEVELLHLLLDSKREAGTRLCPENNMSSDALPKWCLSKSLRNYMQLVPPLA